MFEKSDRPKFFWMCYYVKKKDLGNRAFWTQIHKIRDGLAAPEISFWLYEHGYSYGEPILNIPEAVWKELNSMGMLRDQELTIRERDLVLLSTRPPLDDDRENNPPKRSILRSNTPLEKSILEGSLRQFFKNCDRSDIALADNLRPDTADARVEEFRAVTFYQQQGGWINYLNVHAKRRKPRRTEKNLTVGYLISVPKVDPYGFRLLVCFGAGGTETLWFNYLLRRVYSDYLRQAIESNEPRLWMLPFLVPEWAPFPFLDCDDLSIFKPNIEYSDMIAWSLNDSKI